MEVFPLYCSILPSPYGATHSNKFWPIAHIQGYQIHQNSFNLSSDNPTLDESSSSTRRFAFYQKKASSVKWAYLRDMFKNDSKTVCTSTIPVSHDPFPHTPSTSSAIMTMENTKQDPEDP